MSGEHTRPLEALRRSDEPLFGGKSASLGELIAAGIPVPPGFAVASSAFRELLEEAGLEAELERVFRGVDPDDVKALRSASSAAREAILTAPLPEAVRADVERGYESLDDYDPPVAVRSSALGEDSEEATFAGQQDTYLWVRGAGSVCAAVRDCWASLYSPEAVSYRARTAGAARPPAMGVAVQRMVDAEVSGVMFTCNPVTGDPSTVAVNASWGLGIAVVGGEVTPDEYRLSKVTREVLGRTIASKHVEYRPDLAGGTVRADVPPELREQPCLDDERLEALLELARRVERHFGSPQDVEWAIARQEPFPAGLSLLQSRPVTTAPKKPAPTPGRKSALAMVMSTFGAKPKGGE